MTSAADELLISQPAISSQLKQLERSLDTKLFRRQPRGIKLTPAGETLADYANRIFSLANEATVAIRDLQGLKRGSLRIGVSPTIGVYFLPPLLVHFQRRFPQIQMHVEIEENELIEQRLRAEMLDVGLSPVAPNADNLRAVPFMQEDFLAVAAAGSAFARRQRMTPTQLAQAFVIRAQPSATGALVLGFFARHKVLQLRPLLSLGSLEAVKQAVLAGLGATIISKMAVAAELKAKRLVALHVEGLPMRRPLYQINQVSQSKAAVAFGCLLKHAVRGTLPKLRGACFQHAASTSEAC